MDILHYRGTGAIILGVLLIALSTLFACTASPAPRSALLHTIEACIDPNTPDYCNNCFRPRVDSACAQGRDCSETTEVWEETKDFVALRDKKMCGCSKDFVHGLVLPRERVTGVEDSRRPDAVWTFAWDVAGKRIREESEIALVVNPQGNRSQDQLHIHIVRLLADSRKGFNSSRVAMARTLGEVWSAAAKTAKAAQLKDYGVLVVRGLDDGFIVLVDDKSPEKTYTQWGCR